MQPVEALKRLERIETDIEEIKVFLEDSFLDEEDKKAISESKKDRAAGKLVPSEDVREELGL